MATTGFGDCPCIDASSILSPYTSPNCSSVLDPSVQCFPTDYGSNFCKEHDAEVLNACKAVTDAQAGGRPEFCAQQWCYVDFQKCKQSLVKMYGSDLFPGAKAFYSYETCNGTAGAADAWLDYQRTSPLKGLSLSVAVPRIFFPYIFKRDEATGREISLAWDTEEYFDDSIPFVGSYVDYLKYVLRDSGVSSLDFVSVSRASIKDRPQSYTAAVQDVASGVADMGAGDFWVVPERLKMTPFSMPLYSERIMLWVKDAQVDDSFQSHVKTTMMPFEWGLWGLLLMCIVLVSILNMWFVSRSNSRWGRNGKRTMKKSFKKGKWVEVSTAHRFRTILGALTDSFIASSLVLFVGALDAGPDHTLPEKILSFGYGFLVLVTVAAYTANLVTFLTTSPTTFYYESLEDAMDLNAKVCYFGSLHELLVARWPGANLIPKPDEKSILDAVKRGECSAVLHSFYAVRNNLDSMEAFCEAGMVVTKSEALAMDVALPVKQELVAGISYWIERAKHEGITIESFDEKYRAPLRCSLEFDVSTAANNETHRLSISEMIFPFTVFFLTAAVAVIIKIWLDRKNIKKRIQTTQELNQIHSPKGIGQVTDSWHEEETRDNNSHNAGAPRSNSVSWADRHEKAESLSDVCPRDSFSEGEFEETELSVGGKSRDDIYALALEINQKSEQLRRSIALDEGSVGK